MMAGIGRRMGGGGEAMNARAISSLWLSSDPHALPPSGERKRRTRAVLSSSWLLLRSQSGGRPKGAGPRAQSGETTSRSIGAVVGGARGAEGHERMSTPADVTVVSEAADAGGGGPADSDARRTLSGSGKEGTKHILGLPQLARAESGSLAAPPRSHAYTQETASGDHSNATTGSCNGRRAQCAIRRFGASEKSWSTRCGARCSLAAPLGESLFDAERERRTLVHPR